MLLLTILPLAICYGLVIKAHAMPLNSRKPSTTAAASGIEVPPPEILRFMRRFGYLEPINGHGDAETLYHESAIVEAIKSVQKYGALKQTGKLDNDTLNLLNRSRCGVPDIEGTPYYLAVTSRGANSTHHHRQRRYVIGARPWEKRRIRYFITNWSLKISKTQIERDFARALQLWSKPSGLHFIRVNSTAADIIVGFGTGYHGDNYPFDGTGGVLAHAYYPYETGSWGGDVHFDEDENWETDSSILSNGVDFYAVAAHELGHSLGLAHSPIPTSIMFAYYKGTEPMLDYDDKRAMYDMYFTKTLPDDELYYETNYQSTFVTTPRPSKTKPDTASTTTESTPTFEGDFETVNQHKERYGQIPTHINVQINATDTFYNTMTSTKLFNETTTDICAGNFDAVTVINTSVHIFKDDLVWKLTPQYTVADGYPQRIQEIFPFLVANEIKHIDAAYERFDGNLVVFTGKQFWVYNGSNFIEDSPKLTTDLLINEGEAVFKVDAAMMWPKNNLTYIFAGSNFWRFNDRLKTLDDNYPKSINRWPGIPSNIDAAATLPNGKTYFFKRNLYWLYNNTVLRPEVGYPRRIGPAWLKNHCFSFDSNTKSTFI